MTPRSLLLISAAAIAGWATGAVMRSGRPEIEAASPPLAQAPGRTLVRKPDLDATVPSPSATPLRSTDTLETLKPLRGGELHARLALWLIDASQEDVAAFWDHYRTTLTEEDFRPSMPVIAVSGMGTGRNEISELILYHWLRLNPEAAMVAAKRDGEEYIAWQAWGALDPDAALAAAIAGGDRHVENLVRGLGIFRPAWLRQHLEELPEALRKSALDALTESDNDDPAANLRFLAEQGYGFRPESFSRAIRDDPWAAYDWIVHLEKSDNGRQARDQQDDFIRLAGEEHPEVIEVLVRTTPEGALKRKMEDALFRSRLATDPEGAIREATETEAPAVAAHRLSEAGKTLVSTDPERAFELAKRMFDHCPDAFDTSITYHHSGGSMSYGGVSNGGPEFAKALMDIDPGRVLDLAVAGDNNGTRSSTFSSLLGIWSAADPEGLSAWADGQADEIHDAALYPLLMQAQDRGNYPEALKAASRFRGSRQTSYLENILDSWSSKDATAAANWLQGSGLPASEIEALRKKLPPSLKP